MLGNNRTAVLSQEAQQHERVTSDLLQTAETYCLIVCCNAQLGRPCLLGRWSGGTGHVTTVLMQVMSPQPPMNVVPAHRQISLLRLVATDLGSATSNHGKTAVGASAFDILPTRGVLKAGHSRTVEFAYYARPGQKAATDAVCDVEGGPSYTMPVTADSNAIKYGFSQAL